MPKRSFSEFNDQPVFFCNGTNEFSKNPDHIREYNLFRWTLLAQKERPLSRSSSKALELAEKAAAKKVTTSIPEEEKVPEIKPKAIYPIRVLNKGMALTNLQARIFSCFPTVLFYHMLSFFDFSLKTQVNLARTCKRMYVFFQPAFREMRTSLHQMVLDNCEVAAEAMIKWNPQLLTLKRKVIDHRGREIEGTPWQIALGSLNIRRLNGKTSYMADMIFKYLVTLPNAEAEIVRQHTEFKNDKSPTHQKENDEAIEKLFHALVQIPHNDILWCTHSFQPALQEYKLFLEKVSKERPIITAGLHFDPLLLLPALRKYKHGEALLGDMMSPKKKLWRQVIEMIIGYLPINLIRIAPLILIKPAELYDQWVQIGTKAIVASADPVQLMKANTFAPGR